MWARLRLSWTALLCRVPGIAAAIRGVTKAECLRVCQYVHHTGCQPQSSLHLCGLASSCGLPRRLLIQCSQEARTKRMASSGSLVWRGMLLSLHSNVKLCGKASPHSGGGRKDSKAILQRSMCTWCQGLPAFGSLPI